MPNSIDNAIDNGALIKAVRHPCLLGILVGGFVAGTLDIGAAALINFADPLLILRFIAGGLLGKSALAGGASVTLLGLVLQWAMSLIIAAVYVLAARRLPVLRERWLACGLAYGVVIFFVMNFVVVPLSAWAKWSRFTAETFSENMLAMLLFGAIVAYFAHYYARCYVPDDSTRAERNKRPEEP